ncbi:adhesin, partial [Streptococcus pseudopneumoniae]
MVKKRTILVLMSSVLALVLSACGQKESQSGKGMKIVTSFY